VMFPLFAAHLLRRRDGERAPAWRAAIAIVLAAGVACLFYPFVFKPPPSSSAQLFEYTGPTLEFFGHSVFLQMFNGVGFGIELSTLASFETIASSLALLGIAHWLFDGERKVTLAYWRARPNLCVALAYVVPY